MKCEATSLSLLTLSLSYLPEGAAVDAASDPGL